MIHIEYQENMSRASRILFPTGVAILVASMIVWAVMLGVTGSAHSADSMVRFVCAPGVGALMFVMGESILRRVGLLGAEDA